MALDGGHSGMTASLDVNKQRLRSAPWLRTDAIGKVFAALAATGGVSRVVGGAVRNTLLGLAADDIDIATTATPEAVSNAATAAGLKAIPTGIAHGTVTVVADGSAYEVTTLRRDVATDGRHATVAFTDDWLADASRRDFTINALYCDADGTLFDPLGGAADLDPPRVRFIGEAQERIREDYLRILRFFRFSARFGVGDLDGAGLAACDRERAGFARVSAERVCAELKKLLATDRAAEVCRIMQAHGLLTDMLAVAPSPGRLQRLMAIEAATQLRPDPIRRLAALALHPQAETLRLSERLRLSGAERERLTKITAGWVEAANAHDDRAARRIIYRLRPEHYRDALLVGWADGEAAADDEGFRRRNGLASAWTPPDLPVGGEDVLALGVGGGPRVGRLLAAVESWWIDADFAPGRADCLAELARRAASI